VPLNGISRPPGNKSQAKSPTMLPSLNLAFVAASGGVKTASLYFVSYGEIGQQEADDLSDEIWGKDFL